MKISFVIPAHNEEALIGSCLEAMQKELARAEGARELAPGESEIVVINNASTDRTKEVAGRFSGVRVLDEPAKGLVRARKAGFDATAGELVANIDSDVMLPGGWLSEVLREFQNPGLACLSGPFVYYDLSAAHNVLVKVWYFFGWLFFGFRVQGGNFVLRRAAWSRAGGFDTAIEFYGEDTDVAKRIKKQGTLRWSWKLWVNASGRRLKGEGVLRSAFHYGANFLWVTFTGRPFHQDYQDIRPQ